ncbi:hypothetical protein [Helicobacter sp. T3_23-1059]
MPRTTSCARNDGNVDFCNDDIIFHSIEDLQTSCPPSIAEDFASCPPSLAEGARGWVSLDSTSKTKSTNANIPHPKPLPQGEGLLKPKKLAISIATATLIAGFSIDTAAAQVNCRTTVDDYTPGSIYNDFDGRTKVYTCTGYANWDEMTGTGGQHLHHTYETNQYWNSTVQFGTASEKLTIGGGSQQITVGLNRFRGQGALGRPYDYKKGFYKYIEFGLLDAKDMEFRITSQGQVQASVKTIAQANIRSLILASETENPGDRGNWTYNWDGDTKGIFQHVTIGHSSNIGAIKVDQGTRMVYNMDINDNATIGSITNAGSLTNLRIDNATASTIKNESGAWLGTIALSSSAKVNSIENAGSIGGQRDGGIFLNGASLNSLKTTEGRISNLNVSSGAKLESLEVSGGTIENLNIGGAGSYIRSITGTNGAITNLTLGDANNNTPLLSPNIDAKVTNLKINNFGITVNSTANTWNTLNGTTKQDGQRISLADNSTTNLSVAQKGITINIGTNVSKGEVYEVENLVVAGTAPKGSNIGQNHITGGRGTQLIWAKNKKGKQGFMLEADGSDAYITDVYRAIALSYMRRNAMTQNILDTMTTKTFHSDNYYNQEVELRLLQYDMSRLTNKSTRFSKTKRKNTAKIDKVREKIARLTLTQSKGQDLEKGYNNFELIDQLDAIFIPYTGRRDWRFFALPYSANSYVDLGANSALEWVGGAIFGMQRNLRKNGIFGGYLGYEYNNVNTEFVGSAPTSVQTNSLQGGINYFKTFAVTRKVAEGFIKLNIRAGVDLPKFNLDAGGRINTIEANPAKTKIKIPLVWNAGVELKGGITVYQFKKNSYVAPELGLSYDVLSSVPTMLLKPRITTVNPEVLPIGADEYYGAILWHLPQVQASLRYYKIWGNTFRTNTKIGVRYNVLNNPKLGSFKYGNTDDDKERNITLPLVYGNLSLDFVWLVKKNHELSLGYDGLFYASSFDKSSESALSKWFNGVTTTVNFKYAYWFGGSDYKTDKDGNVIGSNKTKKTKKSKPKKEKSKKSKKSKKKVVYIDG